MRKRVVLVRHGDEPDDDRVVTFFRDRGIEPEIVRPYRGETLGEVDGTVVASAVYGGPFNVFDEEKHPFLHDEARWIGQCMEKGVPLLGICQGAQQIARVLGAEVGPKPGEPTEFGYYEITPTAAGRDLFPESLFVTQSHYHTFDIPAGAEHLAGSRMFPNQAFRVGEKVYAFQFHAEVTADGFRRWQDSKWARYGRPGVQARDEQDRLLRAHDQRQHDWFMAFLDRLFGKAVAPSAVSP
jgi:GMP synthase (glutamine-hydrolysing)